MTDDSIEAKALAMVNAVRAERGWEPLPILYRNNCEAEALCRAIEQHEAFKQEVSDVVVLEYRYVEFTPESLQRFIIPKPKPDPLVEAMTAAFGEGYEQLEADNLRAMLDARGWEIREKGQ